MTTDTSTHPTDLPPRSSARSAASVSRLLDDLRDLPLRYLLVAAACSVALFVLTSSSSLSLGSSFPVPGQGQGLLLTTAALVLAAVPLVALRWPVVAVALAAAPLVLTQWTGLRWPFTVFLALLTVVVLASWRSRVVPGLVAVASLFPIVVLLTGATTMVVPFGYDISFPWEGASLGDRALLLGMYALAATAVWGLGVWMRSSALVARREIAVSARSAEVEGEAAVVGERARLARDLHDVVAHHVSLIAVRAETAPYTHPDLDPRAREVLADIAGDARRALDELRGVLGVLRRAEDGAGDRAPQPQLEDVARLVESARTAGEQVTLSGELDASAGSAQEYVAYRVVQEALTNARRHAPGQPVTVDLTADGDHLRVQVTNPCGPSAEHRGGAGTGLAGMRERVEALGGRLRAGVEGDVFAVEAEMPRGTR